MTYLNKLFVLLYQYYFIFLTSVYVKEGIWNNLNINIFLKNFKNSFCTSKIAMNHASCAVA